MARPRTLVDGGLLAIFFDGERAVTTAIHAVTIPLSDLTASMPEAPQVDVGSVHDGLPGRPKTAR